MNFHQVVYHHLVDVLAKSSRNVTFDPWISASSPFSSLLPKFNSLQIFHNMVIEKDLLVKTLAHLMIKQRAFS